MSLLLLLLSNGEMFYFGVLHYLRDFTEGKNYNSRPLNKENINIFFLFLFLFLLFFFFLFLSFISVLEELARNETVSLPSQQQTKNSTMKREVVKS
jgi:hypothetical protein